MRLGIAVLQKHFQFSRYEDAPELSDQLLLPNLAIGNNVFLVAALVPSYIQKVVKDLATSPEIEPGHLSITFYVPGNLVRESEGITRFKNYLILSLGSISAASEFLDDCLQLIEEGGLSIQVAHGPGKIGVSKGCFGVFTDPKSEDYVAIEDAKGGDYNSPIRPLKSWVPEELSLAEKVLWRTNLVLDGTRTNLYRVDWRNTTKWLSEIAKWFEQNREVVHPVDPAQSSGRLEEEDQSEDFFDDFGLQEKVYGWNDDDLGDFEEFFSAGYSVSVGEKEPEDHHVPPLPERVAALVGLAAAECHCGRKFLRINGCSAIAW